MFDRLMILSEGKTMFYGPADEAVQFFEEIGFMCPDQYNPGSVCVVLRRTDCVVDDQDCSGLLLGHSVDGLQNPRIRT